MEGSSRFLLTLLSSFLLDRLAKLLIRLFGGFYICNNGISFGLPINLWLFWSIIAILFILGIWKRTWIEKVFLKFPLASGLILAGIISNLFDRAVFGCVIDFIDIRFWPIFNLADVSISVGAIMVLAKILKEDRNV